MKNILFVINYITFPWEGGNSRFIYILNNIDYKKNNVDLLTTDFCHSKKEKRKINNNYNNLLFKTELIHELGYNKNVSLKRLYSSYILGKNLKKFLYKNLKKYDCIYCSVPSIEFAYQAVKFAKKNNIKIIIDIQDLWPEAFKMVIDIPIVSKLLFFPIQIRANYIYKNSNEIVAVSDTYVKRGLSINNNNAKGLSVYLGTDLNYFDKCKKENGIIFKDNLIRIVYIGTLGTSYDIKSVIDAIKILKNKNVNNIIFECIGDGPLKNQFESYAKEKSIKAEFTGRMEYSKMVGILCSCDIAINPIVGKSVSSIINKVGDYAAAGLPVINTQNSEEYRNLIEEYQIGFNCENGNIQDIANQLEMLIKNKKLREKMGKNNRKLAEEKFNRNKTYKKIVKLIERI